MNRAQTSQAVAPRSSVAPLRILIAGGGTGGHVYPGLAVADALVTLFPAAEIRFAGTRRGLESLLVPRAGYHLYAVPASGFRGLGAGARLRFLLNFAAGLVRSFWILLRWRPRIILGTGGYASVPILTAARLLRRPCALQEQNAVPGSANRLLGRWVQRVYLGFAGAAQYFPAGRCVVTGNPVRALFTDGTPAAQQTQEPPPRASDAADKSEIRLLIFGGSRGARTLNRAAVEAAPHWRQQDELALWIQTGTDELALVQTAYADFPATRVRVAPYLFDMPAALAWADLAICRAGAMTLAELQAVGKPGLLVPFPHATDDHQLENARNCEEAGAAIVLADSDCTGQALVERVRELAADRPRLTAMSQASAALARPRAARDIALDLLRLAGSEPARTESETAGVS